ncbi:hypothetical protein [Catenovulum sediminis]|uniref:hypothetical protein n=1 Tax=Catenovulum sediminis TaxID=1740262 RepID=UPI00117DEFAE|nr:hypothetical protein [Catenovulum sediminis]
MEAQGRAIQDVIDTPIHKSVAYINGMNRGMASASYHARDRIAFQQNHNEALAIAIASRIQTPNAGMSRLVTIQMGLDAVGMSEVPVVSQLADIGSAGISLSKGDYLAAGLSLLAMIPLVGKAVDASRMARIADRATDLSTVGGVLHEINRNADIAMELTHRALARGRINNTAQAFGTRAHKYFERLNDRLNMRLSDADSPFSLQVEPFRDNNGALVGNNVRLPGTIGADIEIFDNGNIIKALDLKTHGGIEKLIAQNRQADLTKRIGVSVEEIFKRL